MSQLDTMFASRSVPRHLVRGALGLPMMVAAFVLVPWVGPLSLLLLVPAVVLLRGCPGCWAIGLSQTCALKARTPVGDHDVAVGPTPVGRRAAWAQDDPTAQLAPSPASPRTRSRA